MSNRIVSIGYLGCKKCYLNVPREEAIRRYAADEGVDPKDFDERVEEFEFEDEFGAYDVWK